MEGGNKILSILHIFHVILGLLPCGRPLLEIKDGRGKIKYWFEFFPL